jgi:hypothetical protein
MSGHGTTVCSLEFAVPVFRVDELGREWTVTTMDVVYWDVMFKKLDEVL